MSMQIIEACLRNSIERLKANTDISSLDIDNPELDAQLLLAYVLNKSRTFLFAFPEHVLTQEQLNTFQSLIERRLRGEPIAYILERQEFWSLDLYVDKNVLIPRPDTETLVEQALNYIPENNVVTVIDAGTGSGAIALAIASERPKARLLATDLSEQALAVAAKNKQNLQIKNCSLLRANWLNCIATNSVDILLSNPPYIDKSEELKGDVLSEPESALYAPEQGLKDIQILIQQGLRILKPQSYLLVEHGWQQGAAVRELFSETRENNIEYKNIQTARDLVGHERVTFAQLQG